MRIVFTPAVYTHMHMTQLAKQLHHTPNLKYALDLDMCIPLARHIMCAWRPSRGWLEAEALP